MNPSDRVLAQQIDAGLQAYVATRRPLQGIRGEAARQCLVAQLIDSVRRVRYVSVVRSRPVSPRRSDPSSTLFDPIKAAILLDRQGQSDEACWLVFLSVHFGKALRTGWTRVRDVYGSLGGTPWTWSRTSTNPQSFRSWLATNTPGLKGGGRKFGNHRKYQSLDAWAPNGTGDAVQTYVEWVAPPRNHQVLFAEAQQRAARDPGVAFDHLYHSMQAVKSFGRMARFDYLTMIGKIGLTPIEPASVYMDGATGPLAGAQLLFGVRVSASLRGAVVDTWLVELGQQLGVGMQVIEDAICNWQKSPAAFVRFGG